MQRKKKTKVFSHFTWEWLVEGPLQGVARFLFTSRLIYLSCNLKGKHQIWFACLVGRIPAYSISVILPDKIWRAHAKNIRCAQFHCKVKKFQKWILWAAQHFTSSPVFFHTVFISNTKTWKLELHSLRLWQMCIGSLLRNIPFWASLNRQFDKMRSSMLHSAQNVPNPLALRDRNGKNLRIFRCLPPGTSRHFDFAWRDLGDLLPRSSQLCNQNFPASPSKPHNIFAPKWSLTCRALASASAKADCGSEEPGCEGGATAE